MKNKTKQSKNRKPFDTLNGSIPRAAILITQQSLTNSLQKRFSFY